MNTLATCGWVKKGLPLCLTGDSGTGKSHLLIALGAEAAMAFGSPRKGARVLGSWAYEPIAHAICHGSPFGTTPASQRIARCRP
ncbi:ATP-binding protein [Microtetraspora malaysiensis]|uniref:ATP-binding protein n=1 Tax=Microtetraspora malaysiensis TaxID=161358 RepID=UPI003D8F1030